MIVAIVDTGIANFGSVANMISRSGGTPLLASEPSALASAERIVLPGVGSFDIAMKTLVGSGMLAALNDRVLQQGTPVLGICLGMQLFSSGSEEGDAVGLGWLDAQTVRFHLPAETRLRVPHIGWNAISVKRQSPLLDGLTGAPEFYYVHSYHLKMNSQETVLATTDYGGDFPAVIEQRNLYGAQFHPEKSQEAGARLFHNFMHCVQHA